MKIKLLAIALLALGICTSCVSINQTSSTVQVETGVFQYPTVTDLDVSPVRVTKTVEWGFRLLPGPSLADRKSNLLADLCTECQCDILVEPQYKYVKSLFGTSSLTVTGFPAKFKGFRKATKEDIEALRSSMPYLYDVSNHELKQKH